MAESLPEDMIMEILLRLPAKSLGRFKCVCKRWRFLISKRGFAKSHLQRLKAGDPITSQRIIVGSSCDRDIPLETVDYEALDGGGEGRVVEPHGIIPFQERCCIVGSCDGMVCLVGPRSFLIYNPTTRVYIELPGSHFNFNRDELFSELRDGRYCGFGYDSQSDDYKVVKIVEVDDTDEYPEWEAAIFSLRSGSWRRKQVRFQEQEHRDVQIFRHGVYWKGALHWCAQLWNVDHRCEAVIISFDLLREEFLQVLPVPEVDKDVYYWELGIHGVNLFIYNCVHYPAVEAWITDEYGKGASWTKWFSVDCSAFVNCHPWDSLLLAYTRCGKIVFWLGTKRMILFDPESNTCKDYPIERHCYIEYAIYLETLVSPYLGG
ncbi:hypothetical protein BT93_H1346 [Corymbia citriodora subsp. variegata]|nr:hypothetical protein BT93_H1346 [Corymbia citriodora subsp. variegata]